MELVTCGCVCVRVRVQPGRRERGRTDSGCKAKGESWFHVCVCNVNARFPLQSVSDRKGVEGGNEKRKKG